MHDKDPSVYPFQDWGSPKGSDYNVLLYTLPSVAGLSGGTLRLANAFMTPIVGGRNVVAHSSIMLTIAMILTSIVLKSKTAPFTSLLVAAWLSGIGGGAFASSMSNMSALYPKSKQGYCLGINGGFGNLGVSISQLLLPVVMGLPFGTAALSIDDQGDAIEEWPNHGTCQLRHNCISFIRIKNHANPPTMHAVLISFSLRSTMILTHSVLSCSNFSSRNAV